MLSKIRNAISDFLQIRPEDNVLESVAKHFRHNVFVNTMDLAFFTFGDSFVSIVTIIPVFASNLTDSPLVIGLIPAIVNFGWFMPQMFMASYISSLKEKLPFTLRMAVNERLVYLFFPLLALMVPRISKSTALTFLLLLITLRGLTSGLTALPWQELQAKVIPISHRARFWGMSRVLAQIAGVIGSVIATLVLSRLPYPQNFALCFALAIIAQWISFAFYRQNREPEEENLSGEETNPAPEAQSKPSKLIDGELFRHILKEDQNFRKYLIARSMIFLSGMSSGFLAVYGIQRFNLSDAQAAIFTALLYLSGILGYSVGGVIGDKIGPKRVVVISVLIWAVTMVLAIIAPVIWVYYLVFVLFGLNSAGMVLGDSLLVMELGEEKLRPTYLGLARSLTGIFVLLSPILAGWLVESFGYSVMFAISCILSLIAAPLMNQVRDVPRHKTKPAALLSHD
jgi:MFS family permease